MLAGGGGSLVVFRAVVGVIIAAWRLAASTPGTYRCSAALGELQCQFAPSGMADSISILGAVLGALGTVLSLINLWFGRRDRKLQLMFQLNTQYTKDMIQAMSIVSRYRDKYQDCYVRFRVGRKRTAPADAEIQQVEDARRLLAGFWDWVTDVHDSGSFPIGFLSSRNSTWLQRGNDYRVAVEPFDIAKWYGRDNTTRQNPPHYLRSHPAASCSRPRRYYLLQELYCQVYNRKDETVESSLDEAWKQLYPTRVPPRAKELAEAHSLSSDNRQPMMLRWKDSLNQLRIAMRQMVGSL
eukprot:jgi/Chlat1/1522/Chrsp121S01800